MSPPGDFLSRAFRLYGGLTGASLGFNYFAPEIGPELRARFEGEMEDGKRFEETLHTGGGGEVALRLNNIVGTWGSAVGDEETRRRVSVSWAARVFARHPGATRVTVILESFAMPSLDEHRAGARPRWEPFYRATYARRPRLARAGGSR